ncbi:LysR family transcriptional regulator [Streptomyces spiroverticillatus]|uniref:LysR family transcriptional regulator n=1 Tax=Streptomyces finlayi TaxID=67296 RepID=A0A918X8B3_9ACTN|nr:LysR family transcriptional regulator [Streptomyces finlayi]GHA44547.1 LysR family transcriptional regulator [Streptomyces spiroverticillatus]GHD17841.1 LysR family transcriptional regulator [Streptomyces finlayi]
MELRQLRYFCMVAEERNVTRAAELLGIRATSLSQQIIALERDLGAPLFVRTPSGMTPTKAGFALIPQARAALDAAESARSAVRGAAAGDRDPLRVGVTPGCPPWVLRRLWTAADAQTSTLLDWLRRGSLDVGLVVLPLPVDIVGFGSEVVNDEALGVLVTEGHRLASFETVAWPDLAGSELLWFPREFAPGYYDEVLGFCRSAGWAPRVVRERPPRRRMFAAELSGGGDVVALRPEWEAGEGLEWIPLLAEAPRVRHAFVWSRTHSRAEEIAELVREAAPQTRTTSPRGRG